MKVTIQKVMALNETTVVELDFPDRINWDVVREARAMLDARFLEMNKRALVASGLMRELFKKDPDWYNAAMDAQAVLFGQPHSKLSREEIMEVAAAQEREVGGNHA